MTFNISRRFPVAGFAKTRQAWDRADYAAYCLRTPYDVALRAIAKRKGPCA